MIRFGPKAETPDLKSASKPEKQVAAPVEAVEKRAEKRAPKRTKAKDSGGEKLL